MNINKTRLIVFPLILLFNACTSVGQYGINYVPVNVLPDSIIETKDEPTCKIRKLPTTDEINNSNYILLGYSIFKSRYNGNKSHRYSTDNESAIETGKQHGADLVIIQEPVYINSVQSVVNVTRAITIDNHSTYNGNGSYSGQNNNNSFSGQFNYSGNTNSTSIIYYTEPELQTYNIFQFGAVFLSKKKN